MTQTQINGFSLRDRRGMVWLSVAGALLLIAMISTSAYAGGGAAVNVTVTTGSLLSGGTVDVMICGKADCSTRKTDTCPTLDLNGPGPFTTDCGSGGGWKGYLATITVSGTDSLGAPVSLTCTPVLQIGGNFTCDASGDGLVAATVTVQ